MRRNAADAGKRRLLPHPLTTLPRVLCALWLVLTGAAVLGPAGAGAATNWTVTIGASAYSPPTITIHAGDTVTWQLPASVTGTAHTVTSDSGAFSSQLLSCGPLGLGCVAGPASFSFTFTNPGSYPYHDTMVSGMRGTVVVVANSPPPAPSPTSPPPSPSPSPSASPSPTPTPSPSGSPAASGSVTPTPSGSPATTPSPGASGLAAPRSSGGGTSGTTVIALIAVAVAVLCAGGLFWLRRSGAW